jgi:lactate dehydrogenase-like 2-hydroxyacid dehydrogenase
MSSSSPQPIKVAVLDDYLSLSAPHFAAIPPSKASITTFTDALPPYPHPSTTPAQRDAIADRYAPFEVLCTMRERTPFPASLLQRLPNLKLLLCTGTQFNTFDISAAKELGITVTTVHGKRGKGASAPTDVHGKRHRKTDITKGASHPTTQHAWALILALARNVASDDHAMKYDGAWHTGCAIGLTGKTLGIVGLGRLGAAVARIGVLCWGMQVVCWSANLDQDRADAMAESVGLPTTDEDGEKTFRAVSKEALFKTADVVSLHYQLSERSRGIVGKDELGLMKKEALLVNTSRGALIQEGPLMETLREGRIRGVALDTFEVEPLPKESPWRSKAWGTGGTSKVLITPHMGYVDEDNLAGWYAEQAEELRNWLDGRELGTLGALL